MSFAPVARKQVRPRLLMGAGLAALAVLLWRVTQPAHSADLQLTQVTFDAGLSGWPAISADGRRVVYASDREGGGNLELYVQQVPGRGAVRLTDTADDESEPSISPDGASVAYHSSKDGGGIYVMAATGGESRLLAAGGRAPHYSPDGHWITFLKDDAAYIVASGGGTARQFHGDFPALRGLAWSPDSQRLLFWAQTEWWVAPLSGGSAEATGLAARLTTAGLAAGPYDDGTWTTQGLLFSARTGVVRNLYLCPLDSRGKATGAVRRLTNGTEMIRQAAASRDGRVVFAAGRQRFDIWGLALEGNTGKATGPPYRITDSLAPTANPDLSKDGRKLLFGSSQHGFTEVWQKDLVTGKESVAATSAEGASYGRWLGHSGRTVYSRPSGGHSDVYLEDRKLAAGTRAWDVDSKEETVLLSGQGIDALDLKSGRRRSLIKAPEQTRLSEASFSPDDRRVLFLAETGQASRIYVAAVEGGPWIAITDGGRNVDKPRFSADGRLIYYTLDHEGTRGIWGVRFDPQAGRTEGQPFPVFEPHTQGLSLWEVNPQALEIGVARDKLVMILSESRFTIWIADLVPR